MSAIFRITLALGLLFAAIGPAGAAERILRFVSDVKVERNGDLVVTETIAVQAEGNDIRRGILRDFPTSYTRRDGARVEVGFDVQLVTRDGAAENWTTERMSNGVRVRIGSADRLLNTGRHEYVIRYRTTRQIGFFADYDELYWNATGTGWTFAIDQAEARITLPEGVPFRQTALYTGPQGARGQDAVIVEQQPGRIVFRTTKPLPARNGLTVAAAWQKGVVTPPDAAQQAGWLLAGQQGAGRRRHRACARHCLLRLRLDAGRTRSAEGHDHSTVRAAGRDVGRRRALCRPDGLRQQSLHRCAHRARRQRAYQADRPGEETQINVAAAARRSAERNRNWRRSCWEPHPRCC